jgi:hypothetical protein
VAIFGFGLGTTEPKVLVKYRKYEWNKNKSLIEDEN